MEFEKLPWELEEEILSRVPPLSVVRFRTVCKRWHALFNDKRFINNHLSHSRSQFILCTGSQIYSVGIDNLDGNDPSIEIRKLTFDYPDSNFMLPKNIVYCYGFLLCTMKQGVAVWNPWLRQTRWLDYGKFVHREYAMGYDINSNGYKILRYILYWSPRPYPDVNIYETASNTWKVLKFDDVYEEFHGIDSLDNSVSLNGTLYCIAFIFTDSCWYSIWRFTFARERFDTLCRLPCKNVRENIRVLTVFKKDRLSILEQCYATHEIVVWVTKEKIKNVDEEHVVWVNFMTVTIPNFPKLYHRGYQFTFKPCYFIDNNNDKRLVMCSGDQFGQPFIYIVKGDELRKIKIDVILESCFNVYTYVPTLIPILEQI